MKTLFGMPIESLLVGLLTTLILGLSLLALVAWRNRVLFWVGVRNIWRRPAQTSLIILGLMLATLLISSALVTGDTISYSIEDSAVKILGETDLIVQAKTREGTDPTAPGEGYIDQEMYANIAQALEKGDLIDGLTPALQENVPAAVPDKRVHLPSLELLGLTESYAKSFDALQTENGPLTISALASDEAYLSADAAEKLEAKTGDKIDIFTTAGPKKITVAGVYTEGGKPATGPAMVMKLAAAQDLLGIDEGFSTILISGKGAGLAGAEQSKAIEKRLRPVLKGTRFEVDPTKQEALDEAAEVSAMFTGIFLVFGQFSMIAGIMLIFLIFVMLAAERKTELGVIRALGGQRRDLLKLFVFEGGLYALLAGIVGAVAGVGVGWLMIKVMAQAFSGEENFTLTFYSNPQSTLIAYAIGAITTFLIVTISAWRVGRINIVRAIRDLPEPSKAGRSVKWLIVLAATLVLGILVTLSGFSSEQRGTFGLGLSLIVIAGPLLGRWLRLPDRAAFTLAGLGLITMWLAPESLFNALIPGYEEFEGGLELFFLAGIAGVTGAVWTVMYNSDILLKGITGLFGRLKGMAPILKIAVNYPMKSRVKTGLALGMFSLVIFTLVFMSALLSSLGSIYKDTDKLSGGFDIQGVTGYVNPVDSVEKTLEQNDQGIVFDDLAAVGSFSMAPAKIRQAGLKDKKWSDYVLHGIDSGYADSVGYGLHLRSKEYKSDREVWQALVEEPNVAVVHAGLVPAKVNFSAGGPADQWQLDGLYREDKKLPDIYIQAKNERTGKTEKLKVIGVVNEMSLGVFNGIVTSQATIDAVMETKMPPVIFWFKLPAGADIDKSADSLAKAFYENGMETETLEDSIEESFGANLILNRLLQGFMALGLVVGIAALGVIAARSVVERRRQIGMLRAIGFHRGMVRNAFILETSFVALLGIGVGSILGLLLSEKVAGFMAKDMPSLVYEIPWLEVGAIAGLAYAAALLTTYLPARQAAKVYPAEALRYE